MSGNSEMVERVARAIWDATDPTSGDPIAVTLHSLGRTYGT